MNNTGSITININGEDIQLRFGIPANRMMYDKVAEDQTIMEGNSLNEIGITHLINFGYINNCLVNDKRPEKTFGYFLAFVEQAYIDEDIKNILVEISKCFSDSKFTKKLAEGIMKKTPTKSKKK